MMYVPGDKVVVRTWDTNQIGIVTNVRKKKNQILGYDVRTEKGSAYLLVQVDKPENKTSFSINSTLTEIWDTSVWKNDSEPSRLFLDKRIGHTRANYNEDILLEEERHFEKCADFSFPVVGARSW